MNDHIFCSLCGTKNNAYESYCENCGQILHNEALFKNKDSIHTPQDIFTKNRLNQLNDKVVTIDVLEMIINTIIKMGSNRLKIKNNMTTIEKIVAIAKAYSLVIFKKEGNNYGEYAYNVICIDETFDTSAQVATIIHELTHHLFNLILEEIFMYIWNVEKTPMLDALVQLIVSMKQILLISEYCASSIEKEYLPEDYVSYSSFNEIIEEINLNQYEIERAITIGKHMTKYIKIILDTFINQKLAENIKIEFILNNTKIMKNPININDSKVTANPLIAIMHLKNLILDAYDSLDHIKYIESFNKNKELYERSYEKGAL